MYVYLHDAASQPPSEIRFVRVTAVLLFLHCDVLQRKMPLLNLLAQPISQYTATKLENDMLKPNNQGQPYQCLMLEHRLFGIKILHTHSLYTPGRKKTSKKTSWNTNKNSQNR